MKHCSYSVPFLALLTSLFTGCATSKPKKYSYPPSRIAAEVKDLPTGEVTDIVVDPGGKTAKVSIPGYCGRYTMVWPPPMEGE